MLSDGPNGSALADRGSGAREPVLPPHSGDRGQSPRGGRRASGRGSGGGAPPRVHTHRKRSPTDPLRGVSEADSQRESAGTPDLPSKPSGAPNGGQFGGRQRERHYQRRDRLARPSRKAWVAWKADVAGAFRTERWPHAASAIEQCGRQCFVSACGACGEENASIRISLHCNLRACPDCSRRLAADRARTLTGAALRVADMVATEAPRVIAKLDAELAEARAAVSYWTDLRDRALGRAEKARTSATRQRELVSAQAHQTRADAAEERRRRAQWDRSRAGEWRSWRWSLVTISPPWNPMDPNELTVEGLRRRVADVWERWDRVWSRLSSGGLAAGTAHVEISDHAHVHVHALVFGPFVLNDTLREAAACIVDRPALKINDETYAAALGDLVREAAKYCVKSSSAMGHGWITGDGEHGNNTHPETAARWTIALHRAQTIRHYGTMRAAVSAETEAQPTSDEPVDDLADQRAPRCPCCGADELLPVSIRLTVDVARKLGPDAWRSGWHGRESPPAARVAGAGERLPPRVGYFWRLG